VAESNTVESDLIPRIATGFCSGISRTCGLCGAVSGAILAVSMLFGRDSPDQPLDTIYSMVQQMLERFERTFGETGCKELIGCDLRTAEGQKTYLTENLYENCKSYIEEATRMVIQIIEENA